MGTIVRARATDVEMQNNRTLGRWSAKGVVHGVSMQNTMYYVILWLCPGVGSLKSSSPGQLSRPIIRLSLQEMKVGDQVQFATVFHDEGVGDLVISCGRGDAQ